MSNARPILTDAMNSLTKKKVFLDGLRDAYNSRQIAPEDYMARKKLLTQTMDKEIAQETSRMMPPRVYKNKSKPPATIPRQLRTHTDFKDGLMRRRAVLG